MSVTWQDVVNIAPELGGTAIAVIAQAAYLAAATRQVDPASWLDLTNDGIAYLAAHLAALRNNEGLVTSERLGEMARTYALPPGIKGSLALSVYGAEYLRMTYLLDTSIGFCP